MQMINALWWYADMLSVSPCEEAQCGRLFPSHWGIQCLRSTPEIIAPPFIVLGIAPRVSVPGASSLFS